MTNQDDIDRVISESSAPPDMSGRRRLDTNVVRMAKRLDAIEKFLEQLEPALTRDRSAFCMVCVHRYVPIVNEPCNHCETITIRPSQWVAK